MTLRRRGEGDLFEAGVRRKIVVPVLPSSSLLPEFVHQVTAAIGPGPEESDASPRDAGSVPGDVTPEEQAAYGAEVARMGVTRRTEFLAGRRCARAAISACAPEIGAVALPVGERRAPVWPAGIVGAITHTSRLASAAAARSRDARGIGLDVEERMSVATAHEVLSSVAAVAEVDLVRRVLRVDEAAALTLVFSAKESVYKCLYPLSRRYFDYREAELVRVDGPARRCALRIAVDLGEAGAAGTCLDVAFAVGAEHIWTACWLAPA